MTPPVYVDFECLLSKMFQVAIFDAMTELANQTKTAVMAKMTAVMELTSQIVNPFVWSRNLVAKLQVTVHTNFWELYTQKKFEVLLLFYMILKCRKFNFCSYHKSWLQECSQTTVGNGTDIGKSYTLTVENIYSAHPLSNFHCSMTVIFVARTLILTKSVVPMIQNHD